MKLTLLTCLLAMALAMASALELQLIKEVFGINQTHYGDPVKGCLSDEVAVRIQGVPGGICSPPCHGFSCPTDVPDGCDAKPQCALQDGATHRKYCALVCQKGTECGEGASCKMIGLVGICTYD